MTNLKHLAAFAAAAVPAFALPGAIEYLDSRQAAAFPSKFEWTSTDALVGPKNDGRGIAGIKDPSIILKDNVYHVFASTAQDAGYNMVYFNFTNFNDAGKAPFYYLDQSGIGTGYRAAPEVFYFAPQKLWYLIYQNGNAAYSTNPDLSNPKGWTAPKTFYNGTPKTIDDRLSGGYWVDMWVICDDKNCHLFSSDDNGHLYRSQTPISQFPNGMNEPVIAMEEKRKEDMFEASNVYTYAKGKYLLLVECIGSAGRYFRSWTSTDIAGPWKPLAATESNPFLGASNVKFTGKQWTKSISHGELIRTSHDQTLSIDPCKMRYLYQGVDPASNVSYNSLPWRLGLAELKNPAC